MKSQPERKGNHVVNNTRKEQKENTSTYLLQTFFASEHSHSFHFLSIDMVILYTISRYLDMPKNSCFAKQTVLAHECRIKRFHFAKRCEYLVKIGLLFRYTKGKLYYYELGHVITGVAH